MSDIKTLAKSGYITYLNNTAIGQNQASTGVFTSLVSNSLTTTNNNVTGDLTIADKIVHANDTNTAIRFPTADTVTVETSGSERFRINSSGNVGIGTIAPTTTLHVATPSTSGSTTEALRLQNNGTGANTKVEMSFVTTNTKYGSIIAGYGTFAPEMNFVLPGITQGNFTFTSNTTEYLRINSSGNIGIGQASPSAKLDVVGDIEVNSNVNLNSEATTLATTTKTQIASFVAASFRSAKLIVQAYDSVTGEVQVSELLVAHNGTTASSTEYGVVFTGTNPLVIYDVDINSSNVRLMATRTTANSTQYKISETLMVA